MLIRYKTPKTILWVVNLFGIFFLIFSLFRLATYFAFSPPNLHFTDVLPSFLMGVQYDLRWIAIILLPIVLISMVPKLSPFYAARNKKWWTWYLAVITFIVFFFFAADFGSFSYNRTRLDAGAMNFVEDPGISIRMIWQTYPLFWMLLGLVIAVVLFRWMYHKSHWRVVNQTEGLKIPYRRKYFIITAILLAIFIHGQLALAPLTWKQSFRFRDNFKSYLALNPLQNFFTTLKLRAPEYHEQKARIAFPLMADVLQLPPSQFTYRRVVAPGSTALESRPNVVLVMCESFSMYKSSMSGNPLGSTPYFDSLTRNGIFFERCFSPHFSTARGLFAIVTGIPDAQLFKFSTRNPGAMTQHTIIDNFEGYNKHYFLGGSPEFNNFEGLLKNINGLKMHTEGSFHAPRINVWGISDKDLFLEANDVFRQQDKPFFAIIQTSDNHRPYMIPDVDTALFKKKIVPDDELLKYGFGSVEEYNSFRYSDFCFRTFLEAAQKESYFHNTIFVFIGDHGVAGNAEAMYPSAWTDQRLTDEHVPLLFYAPYLLKPQKRSEVVSQVDVLPTVAGMIQQPYVNTTLGRDLLDPAKKQNLAFITNTAGKIGLVTDDFYFIKNLNFPDEQMVPVRYSQVSYTKHQRDSIQQRLSELTSAYFETARYLLMNNQHD